MGSSLRYLEVPEEGESLLRGGTAAGPDADDHETALPDSQPVRRWRRGADTGTAAAARRKGRTRRAGRPLPHFGAYLTGNLVEPLVRLGDWTEATRLPRTLSRSA